MSSFMETIDTKRDFRSVLQSALVTRCERNPRYSLRAFAQNLGVSHATLSHILAGRRPLTEKAIRKLGTALGMNPSEIVAFVSKNRAHSEKALPGPRGYQDLTIDTFAAISEWYHDAIMELSHLPSFKADPKWIARVLGITVSEVNIAVDRLQRLELLKVTPEGEWLDLSKNNSTPLAPDFATSAMRKYQKKILELSMNALEEVPKSDREHVSNMIAVQKGDLLEVKKKIDRFRWRLTAFLQRKAANPNEVYQLAISFFPITKSVSKNEEKS